MFGGNKKLKFDLECFLQSKAELENAIQRLTDIQNKLENAMTTLRDESGWSSKGSDAFYSMYNATWVEGVTTRRDIMQRMCDHLQTAYQEYEPVKTEADNLRLETN